MQVFYKRWKCILVTKLDRSARKIMTAASAKFKNFLWSRFLIILQNGNMTNEGKIDCTLIRTSLRFGNTMIKLH